MTSSPTTTITTMSDLTPGAGLPHLHTENRNIDALEKMDPSSLMLKDRDGETALHYAAINEDIGVCRVLIRRNPALLNVKDVEEKTAYDWILSYNEEYNSHGDILTFLKDFYTTTL